MWDSFGNARLPWSRRQDGALAAGLALLCLLARWPYRAHLLWGWDSVLFALSLEDYDIQAARPHPPGYPVYVALGRIFYFFTGDANAALIGISLLSSAAGVALLYGFMRQVGSRRAAFSACLLLVFSPVFFLNGVVALSYATEVPFSVGLAWLAWSTKQRPSLRKSAAIAAVLALGIGVRQSLLFTLTPIAVLGALWPFDSLRSVAKRAGVAALTGFLVGLSWFAPMLIDTRPERWLALTRNQSPLVFGHSVFEQGWDAVRAHAEHVLLYLDGEKILLPVLGGLVAAAILCAVVTRRGINPRVALGWPPGMVSLVVVWLVPGILFTLLVHTEPTNYNSGYALVYVPGLYAVFASLGDASIRGMESVAPSQGTRRFAAALGMVLLLLPLPLLAPTAAQHAQDEIAHTEDWIGPWLHLADAFPANDTALLTGVAWLWVKWYYPEHITWSYFAARTPAGEPRMAVLESQERSDAVPFYTAIAAWPETPLHPVPSHIQRIAVLNSFPADALRPEVQVETVVMPDGLNLWVFATLPDHTYIEDYLQPI